MQPAALDRASLLPLDREDATKARDAIIVAIGISSVLVINVAYVGYITTPGGPDPYWADCFYGVFVAYFVLNGFALVFSVAALCAVTWGPFVLVWCKRSTWRTPVVNLGLAHLAISLASLLGAFACAGFVAASVGAPELNCGNLRCVEGGVPCNAFSLEPGAAHNTSHGADWQPWVYNLNPVIAKLNNATFRDLDSRAAPGWDSTSANVEGQGVVCHSYSHIAMFSNLSGISPDGHHRAGSACTPPTCRTRFDGVHGDGVLDDADGKPVNTTCLVLIDKSVFGSGKEEQQDRTHVLYTLLAPAVTGNPYTFWCSVRGSGLGPGWLPLQLYIAAQLLDLAGSKYIDTDSIFGQPWTKDMYAVNGSKGQETCPHIPGFEKVAKPFWSNSTTPDGFPSTLSGMPVGVELLISSSTAKTSDGSCIPVFEVAGYPDPNGVAGDAFTYATLLGGYFLGSRVDCPVTYSGDAVGRVGYALGNATYYPSLQYQCSKLTNGVLCDFSASPPLSVDAEGRFLDKKSLSKQSDAHVYVTSLTTTSVEYAVIAMLAVALVAILGTLAELGGKEVAREGLRCIRAWFAGTMYERCCRSRV